MSAQRDTLGGYRLVGLSALILLAMSAAILAIAGTGEDGLRLLIRATARTSVILFGFAFAASSLRRLWPTPETGWLLRQRRYVGLSFAVSHFLHLAAIGALSLLLGDGFEVTPVTKIFGGGAYVMLTLMVATSFDRSAAWLGPRRWRLLHKTGMYWLWIVFANSYLARAVMAVAMGSESPLYLLPALWVLAMLGVRIAAWLRARRPRSVPVTA
jgi:hypothetical protein